MQLRINLNNQAHRLQNPRVQNKTIISIIPSYQENNPNAIAIKHREYSV